MLHTTFYRDRLVASHFKGGPFEKLMDRWDAGVVIEWRWGSLVAAAKALRDGRGALVSTWSLRRFEAAGSWSTASVVTELATTFDEAVRSSYFWAYVEFIIYVNGALEEMSSWAEGCPCHSEHKASCCFNGRRSAEMAAGAFLEFVHTQCALATSYFLVVSTGLQEEDQANLLSDWTVAMECLTTEVRLKTAHWQGLPWMLAGLALPDDEAARAIGRKAIRLFEMQLEQLPQQAHHLLTRRFLDPNFAGPGESLRSELDDFLGGATRRSLPNFCCYVGSLALMKSVERTTEGMHRDIKLVLCRAPNASSSYISTEIRSNVFKHFLGDPAVSRT